MSGMIFGHIHNGCRPIETHEPLRSDLDSARAKEHRKASVAGIGDTETHWHPAVWREIAFDECYTAIHCQSVFVSASPRRVRSSKGSRRARVPVIRWSDNRARPASTAPDASAEFDES